MSNEQVSLHLLKLILVDYKFRGFACFFLIEKSKRYSLPLSSTYYIVFQNKLLLCFVPNLLKNGSKQQQPSGILQVGSREGNVYAYLTQTLKDREPVSERHSTQEEE